LLVVVLRPGANVGKDELLTYIASKVAKWWVLADVIFAQELPHTATGKLLKTRIRELYA